jgi:predicted nucleic acid-binding protein
LRIAADTNVLIDLADAVESVLDALAVIEQRLPDSEYFVTPSVLDELAYFCDLEQDLPITVSAKRAME